MESRYTVVILFAEAQIEPDELIEREALVVESVPSFQHPEQRNRHASITHILHAPLSDNEAETLRQAMRDGKIAYWYQADITPQERQESDIKEAVLHGRSIYN